MNLFQLSQFISVVIYQLHDVGSYHIKTNPVIFSANDETSVIKELNSNHLKTRGVLIF